MYHMFSKYWFHDNKAFQELCSRGKILVTKQPVKYNLQFMASIEISLAIVLTLLLLCLSRRYSRLSSVPGPFIASITDLWRWTSSRQSLFNGPTLTNLHRRYGKLVRIGPNMVSVGDPEAVAKIYGTSPVLEKVNAFVSFLCGRIFINTCRALPMA